MGKNRIPARMNKGQQMADNLRYLTRNGITPEYMQREVDKAYKRGQKSAIVVDSEFYLTTCYAAALLAVHEEFGFGHDRCLKMLGAMDRHVTYTITSDEIAQEVLDKLRIKLNFKGVLDDERIQEG